MRRIISLGTCALASVTVFFGAWSQAPAVTTGTPVLDYSDSWKHDGRLEAYTTFDNPTGKVGVLFEDGPIDIKGHPFFRPMGTTGRSCATCHDPASSMSISTAALNTRWAKYGERDPVFAAVDGANCPTMMPGKESHSILLNRGAFRVTLPWPPRDERGRLVEREFDIEVVRDPTGCNTDAKYGLKSANPRISVYRRPRILANMKFITNETPLLNRGGMGISAKTGFAIPMVPGTTRTSTLNMMADSRVLGLHDQHEAAIRDHMPGSPAMAKADMDKLLAFSRQVYAAQVFDVAGGNLVEPGGPPGLGPRNIARAKPGYGGENLDTPVFQSFDMWRQKPGTKPATESAAFRASVARGADLFISRVFLVRDVNGINTVGLGNPVKRSCAMCHNTQMSGQDQVPGWMDIGTSNWPWAKNNSDLPQFKITCRSDVRPAPYIGRVVYTTDPGRALITGRCADIGMITIQQLRGLAGRAPYFSNGSAKNLREVIDFYDKRFQIGYTEEEKQDLVNFMRVL